MNGAKRADIRRILTSAGCVKCLDEMMRVLDVAGGLPQADEQARAGAEDAKRAARALLKSLENAVHFAKHAARLSRTDPARGLVKATPEEKRLTALEAMVRGVGADLARYTSEGGRPKVYGTKHLVLGIWGVLERAGVQDRKRASITRDCLIPMGIDSGQIATGIKYVRQWNKAEKTPVN